MARVALRQLSHERRALQLCVMQRSLARREPLDCRVTQSAQLGCAALGALQEPLRTMETDRKLHSCRTVRCGQIGERSIAAQCMPTLVLFSTLLLLSCLVHY